MHILIRFRNHQCINWQHSDCTFLRKSIREIIIGLRATYDTHTSPAYLGAPPSVLDRSNDLVYYDPYSLFQVRGKTLQAHFNTFKRVVNAQYRLRGTRDGKLYTELLTVIKKCDDDDAKFTFKEVVEEIKFWITHIPSEVVLSFPSIFEVGIDKWLNHSHFEYFYASYEAKYNPQTKPIRKKIPFYKCGISQYLELLILCNLSFEEYPAKTGPYSSGPALLSHFESIFMYVLFYYNYYYSYIVTLLYFIII